MCNTVCTVRTNLATLVDDFRRHGDQIAIVDYRGNRRLRTTYVELADDAHLFASLLAERKIAPGERVILWGQNGREWVAAFFGCVLRGVLAVPLDVSGSGDFALRVIAETAPSLLIADRSLLLHLNASVPAISFEELTGILRGQSPANETVELTPDTPLQILFTSGTTAEPKGIVHTHRNVLASLEPIEREMQKYLKYERIFHPLRFLHTLPLSHVFGQFMGLWIPALLAAEVHFESRLQATRIVSAIREERISVLCAVPRVLELLRSYLLSVDPMLPVKIEAARGQRIWNNWWRFHRVHYLLGLKFWACVCGGASLPADLEQFWSALGFALIQGYGMTETTALITLNHPFRIGKGTIGKPLPGREIRISDDGEMLVRGDMVANATWQHGAMQTRPDPWLATGDLVSRDAADQLHFVGRKSEVIVTSAGLNIHPEDMEEVLARQQGVKACAVVPLSTPGGEEPVAVLIVPAGTQVAELAAKSANSELADFQRIRRWRLWPDADLPRTSTGKVQRRKVAEWVRLQYMSAQQQLATTSGSAKPDSSSDALFSLLASISGSTVNGASAATRLDEDLHLDSLGRVQLQTELEQRYGVSIDDESLARLKTVGELRSAAGWQPIESPQTSPTPEHDSDARTSTSDSPAESVYPPVAPALTAARTNFLYPRWPWWRLVHAIRVVFIEAVVRPLVRLLAQPDVISPLPANSDSPPMLLIANHVTAYDGALILFALPRRMRDRIAVAMAGDMLDNWRHARGQGNWLLNALAPLQYWLVTALFNVFPLPGSAGFRQSFEHIGHALDNGYHVLIFPEGRRSDDGRLQPFRAGIGLLARESNARILPVALKGLGQLKQGKARWLRSGKISIQVGEPIDVDPLAPPQETVEKLQDTVKSMLSS